MYPVNQERTIFSMSVRVIFFIGLLVLTGCSGDKIMESEKQAGMNVVIDDNEARNTRTGEEKPEKIQHSQRRKNAESHSVEPLREGINQKLLRMGKVGLGDLFVRPSEIPVGYFQTWFSTWNMNTGSYLTFSFENDFLNYSDRYYTNGLRLDYAGPHLSHFPLHRILFPYRGQGMNYYGITLVQHMFTPFTTKTGGVHEGDRPYAGYLYFGFYKISHDAKREIRITSEIELGMIGPSSLGEQVQKAFHAITPENSEPLGWENQVKDGFVFNYSLLFSKMLYRGRYHEFNFQAGGKVGTLHDQLSTGFQFRIGHLPSFLSHELLSRPLPADKGIFKNLDYHLHLQVEGRLIGYDATLQGRMFANSDPYTLPAGDIQRGVMASNVGFQVSYGRFSLLAEQHLLSPEFKGGKWHKWIKLAITAGF